jgi:hypothetical protein
LCSLSLALSVASGYQIAGLLAASRRLRARGKNAAERQLADKAITGFEALLRTESERADRAIAAFESLAQRLEASRGPPAVVVAASTAGGVKPVSLAVGVGAERGSKSCQMIPRPRVRQT